MEYPNVKTTIDEYTMSKSLENIRERKNFQMNFSWAVPTPEAVKSIVDFAGSDTIYEIGAGKGYWAYFINEMNGKIKCFDNPDCVFHYFKSPVSNDFGQNIADISQFKTFYPVDFCATKDVVRGCKNAKVLMFCWPEYDKSWAYEYLKTIKPDKLIYIGEGYGGCCADDSFFKYIERCYDEYGFTSIPQWDGLHDYVMFYTRKEKKHEMPEVR